MSDENYDFSSFIISDYSQMTPAPIIKYDNETNSIVFNNPIVPASGIASAQLGKLSFEPPALFQSPITVIESNSFVPMPLPSDPMSLNIPAIASNGTIQATDLMIAKDGTMKFYSDINGTHVYGDLVVDGNITSD